MVAKSNSAHDRRMRTRIQMNLPSRYLLADGREAKGSIVDVSLHGASIRSDARGQVGDPIIVYVDQIGRLEGKIARLTEDGFAIVLTVTTRATEKFAQRLAQLQSATPVLMTLTGEIAKSQARGAIPSRSAEQRSVCHLIDLSPEGAVVKLEGKVPLVGEMVKLGELRGKVVSRSADGVTIQFTGTESGASKRAPHSSEVGAQ